MIKWFCSAETVLAVIKHPRERLLTASSFLDSEPAAKVMVELLGSYTEDNASQARVDAHRYTNVLLLSSVAELILKHIYSRVLLHL